MTPRNGLVAAIELALLRLTQINDHSIDSILPRMQQQLALPTPPALHRPLPHHTHLDVIIPTTLSLSLTIRSPIPASTQPDVVYSLP
jgi:hypothetical protein